MARSIPYYDDGLQVAYPDFSQKQSIVASPHGAGTDGKEVHHGMYGEGKEVYHGAYEQKEVYIEDDSRKARKRICGLSPLVFWLVVAIAVLVVGGAVGGGVGGSLASKNSRETVLERYACLLYLSLEPWSWALRCRGCLANDSFWMSVARVKCWELVQAQVLYNKELLAHRQQYQIQFSSRNRNNRP